MSRPGRKVYQITEQGKRIATFKSVLDASICCELEYNYLYNRIMKKLPAGDHFFSYNPKFKPPKINRPGIKISDFFDIVAWARIMRY